MENKSTRLDKFFAKNQKLNGKKLKSKHSEIDNVEALIKKGQYLQAEDKIRILLKKKINSEKLQNLFGVSFKIIVSGR